MDSREKFAQMLREGYEALDPEKEQREYIRELLRRKEQQRKRRIKTITAVAAAFLIVVGAVLAVGGCFGSVEADKNDRTKVEEQDGSVVISDENADGQEVGSVVISDENADGQEVGSESVIETDWNKVDKLKEKYPEMITFTDVPEGMEFVSVEVKEEFDIAEITYCFINNGNDIRIFQNYCLGEKQQTKGVEISDEYVEYKGYKVHIEENSQNSIATIISDFGTINVIGEIKEKEIFNVLDKIKAS